MVQSNNKNAQNARLPTRLHFKREWVGSTSYGTLKDAYDVAHTMATSEADAGQCPPFEVLAYAVRNILKPSFLLKQIPDLLLLLANIETVRQMLAKTAEDLHRRHPRRTLSAHDYEAIVQLRNQNSDIRNTIRQSVNALASLDIHCDLREMASSTVVEAKMSSLYFLQYVGGQPLQPRNPFEWACWVHFHQNLSRSEIEELRKEGETVLNLIDDVSKFRVNPTAYAAERGVTPAFDACFPQPWDPEEISEQIEWYLDEVEKLVNVVESLG